MARRDPQASRDAASHLEAAPPASPLDSILNETARRLATEAERGVQDGNLARLVVRRAGAVPLSREIVTELLAELLRDRWAELFRGGALTREMVEVVADYLWETEPLRHRLAEFWRQLQESSR